ncbi:MAG: hypothetical protein ACFB20_08125 [Opitutales bacterium]
MKKIFIISLAVFSTAVATNAQSFLTAGWDFSQYSSAGFSSLAGFTPVQTLDANYSDLASSSFGAGPSASSFGRLYYDGSFGSSSSTPALFPEVVPTTSNLTANTNVSRSDGALVPFNSLSTLSNEGQPNANAFGLSITANSQVFSLVFASTPVGVMTEYSLFSFAGQSTGADIDVTLEFSTDGASYAIADSYTLTSSEQTFSTSIDSLFFEEDEPLFARLNFNLDSADAVIDNVAFNSNIIPEPSAYAVILGLSTMALAMSRRLKKVC